ncbi:MAG: flagellar biosynthetic protein FliP [Pseudomonadota bacterium]|jgi:flagellar biosynthetic protein FliP
MSVSLSLRGRFLGFLSFSIFCFIALLLTTGVANAQVTLPTVNLGFKSVDNPSEMVNVIRILMMLTVLTLAPAILIMMTGFTRIIIVLSFLRQALGLQQMPPNQLLIGLALFLTFFVMNPALTEINEKGLQPYLKGQISQEAAFDVSIKPLRRFMFNQTRDSDLSLFLKFSRIESPKTRADVPTMVLIPSFIVSELKTAFLIGFIIFLPFLVIDMVAASSLMAMGMMMLPPTVISLPLKVMLFIVVDGWGLLIGSMVKSFG